MINYLINFYHSHKENPLNKKNIMKMKILLNKYKFPNMFKTILSMNNIITKLQLSHRQSIINNNKN
jgi:hypothetical protein